jgi:hypothetical protein
MMLGGKCVNFRATDQSTPLCEKQSNADGLLKRTLDRPGNRGYNTDMSKTATKPKSIYDKIVKIDDYVCVLWNDVEEGKLSPNQIGDRLDKVIRMLGELQDSL